MGDHRKFRFAIEYCVDYNATEAVIRCGLTENRNSAQVTGSRLLSDPIVQEKIKERQRELAEAAELTPEWVLERWKEIARGDPADLARAQVVNCRHCHGYGGFYQWTPMEYRAALDRAVDTGKPAPECLGGIEFNPTKPPNPKCYECGGEGMIVTKIIDTHQVTGNSRKLFAGIKQTTAGIEIKTRDQEAALANIAKYLGMSVEKREISGPGGRPLGIANLTSKDLTDDQLAAIIGADDKPDSPADPDK